MPTGSILDTLTAHRAVATIPAVITDQMADKYWLDAVSERTFSITGALAIAMGGWLLLNAVATKAPDEFFGSTQTIYGSQLMAIGGIAQHTKATRRKED